MDSFDRYEILKALINMERLLSKKIANNLTYSPEERSEKMTSNNEMFRRLIDRLFGKSSL